MLYTDEWKDFLDVLHEGQNPNYRARVKPAQTGVLH